jgi:hypothetical protein
MFKSAMVIFIQQYLYFRQFKEALPKTALASQNQSLFQAVFHPVFTPFTRKNHGFNARQPAILASTQPHPRGRQQDGPRLVAKFWLAREYF